MLRWLRLARDTASGLVLMYELVGHLYTVAGLAGGVDATCTPSTTNRLLV